MASRTPPCATTTSKPFNRIYIDNLNGDKYRTGKTTPEGKPDPSAFSTSQNREGIQVGTAIATLVRESVTTHPTDIHLRDFGVRQARATPRGAKSPPTRAEPAYATLPPAPASAIPSPTHPFSAYTSWPRLPELFPVSFPGIKTGRDTAVIDIDRERLENRMRTVLRPEGSRRRSWARLAPRIMEDRAACNQAQ